MNRSRWQRSAFAKHLTKRGSTLGMPAFMAPIVYVVDGASPKRNAWGHPGFFHAVGTSL